LSILRDLLGVEGRVVPDGVTLDVVDIGKQFLHMFLPLELVLKMTFDELQL
jgi:hypothetical protein